MGTLYIQTSGSADNSGSTDQDAADLSGTGATHLGAGVIQLDVGTDLSGVVTTAGATQSTINIAGATNTNQTIFWITAKDDGADTVTVTPTPTGIDSPTTSNWKIGGRFYLGATASPTNARIEAALRAGDTAIINDNTSAQAATIWTFRNAGTSAAGYAKIRGKTGTRPVLNTTNTSVVVSTNSLALCMIENLQLDQDGASGAAIAASGQYNTVYNVKIVDAGGDGVLSTSSGLKVIGCEISGIGGTGVSTNTLGFAVIGNYIHDCGTDGILASPAGPAGTIAFNVVDTCTGRGIRLSGATTTQQHVCSILNNTVYNCGNSGLEVTDADTVVVLMNNIFMNNGNAATESNVEWVAGFGEATGLHGYNVLYNNSGADAPINFTVNAMVASSELTTDPLMVDPANGDFRISASSPGKATGFPGQLLGAASLGYIDMGALQRAEPGAGYPATRVKLGM